MRIQERLDDAVQALHRGSQGRLSVPVPHGVRIVAFRTVPEEDVSRIIADLENTAALLDETELVVEQLANDLEAEVKQRWGDDERLASRLARDLYPVVEARAFLARVREGK